MPLKLDPEAKQVPQYDKNGVAISRDNLIDDVLAWQRRCADHPVIRDASRSAILAWAKGIDLSRLKPETKGRKATHLKVKLLDSDFEPEIIEAWLPGRFTLFEVWLEAHGY